MYLLLNWLLKRQESSVFFFFKKTIFQSLIVENETKPFISKGQFPRALGLPVSCSVYFSSLHWKEKSCLICQMTLNFVLAGTGISSLVYFYYFIPLPTPLLFFWLLPGPPPVHPPLAHPLSSNTLLARPHFAFCCYCWLVHRASPGAHLCSADDSGSPAILFHHKSGISRLPSLQTMYRNQLGVDSDERCGNLSCKYW